MKNQQLNIEELNIQELNIQELGSINGGSQWSDDICYYFGVGYRMLKSFSSAGAEGSANRFA